MLPFKEVVKREKILFLAAAAASGKSLLPQELKNLTKGNKDKAPEAGIEKGKADWSK